MRMMTPKGKRIFAWVLAVLMAAMFIAPALSTLSYAADDEYSDDEDYEEEDHAREKAKISDLNAKYADLQKEQQAISAKISQTQSEKQKKLAQKEQINNQINNTIAQIDLLNERIELLEENIAEKEKELKAKQKEIDANFELFKKRVRALCSTRESTTLGMVLGADSFSDFLTRTEVTTRVSQHDTEMIEDLTRQKEELLEIKKGIEDDKAGVQNDRDEQAEKKEALGAQMQQAQSEIQDIAAMEREFLANKEKLSKQMQQVQAEIAAIFAEINRNSAGSKYVGGIMQWPVPSLGQITCPYGSRFGGSDFHTGIDISGAGAYGATIIAANSGTVKVANTTFTTGYGYGKYVIIDHGGGIQTLYGHCSALNVRVGQVVTTGEKIAEVGSTGWSTGPHVHFEIRQNNKAINPLSGGWLGKN